MLHERVRRVLAQAGLEPLGEEVELCDRAAVQLLVCEDQRQLHEADAVAARVLHVDRAHHAREKRALGLELGTRLVLVGHRGGL